MYRCGGSELALAEGAIAGYAASGNILRAQALLAKRSVWQRFAAAVSQTFILNPTLKNLGAADTFLCRCEDVTLGEIDAATGWAAAKLHSRCGMGACQGKSALQRPDICLTGPYRSQEFL